MINRVATITYTRANGATATLAFDKYENEPDFQTFALTRSVSPHDPSFATFAGFDVRAELDELLLGQFADPESPEFADARERVIEGFEAVAD